MTVQPEVPRHNPDNEPLHEALQARFDALLRNTAEQLELCAPPDTATFITQDARFGRYGEDELNIEHIIESKRQYVYDKEHKQRPVAHRFHYGTISYLHNEDATQTYTAKFPTIKNEQFIWETSKGRWYGEKLLQKLNDGWPHYDDLDRDELRKRIHDKESHVDPQYIFDTLETYTLRNQTGQRSYNLEWGYADPVSSFIGQEYVDSINLSIRNEERFGHSFRKITATHTMPYSLNGYALEITTVITTDEFGNVRVMATYPDPRTDVIHVKRIANYDEYIRELTTRLEDLVSEKSDM